MPDRTSRGGVADRSAAVAGGKRACLAETKQGGACRAFPLDDGYCFIHSPNRTAEVRQARRKGAQAAGQRRVSEGRRKKLDSASDLIRFTAGVVQDVLSGAVGPDVARACLYGISIQRQLIEASDLERRLVALEQQRLPAHQQHQQGRSTSWRQ